ncbi:MAG: hypothetical protein II957_03055 [Treponema sp.]|nr:hypothetical protein [Treponema sp.]
MKSNLTACAFRMLKYFFVSTTVFFASVFALASCSAGNDDGCICIALPSREDFSRAGLSAARTAADLYLNVFITGDYEAKKTIPVTEDDEHKVLSVTFDKIPAGAKVRVACGLVAPAEGQGVVGIGDEITVLGGQEQNASVKLRKIEFETVAIGGGKIVYFEDSLDEQIISLPSVCNYKFTYKPLNGGTETVYETSYPYFTTDSSAASGEKAAIIFCNGTEILKISITVA